MHILSPLLLSLSAGALALPTTNNDNSFQGNTTTSKALEARGTFGWISTWAPDDIHCKGGYDIRSRPKLDGTCQKWVPSTNNIGLNWGTYPMTFESLRLFSDDGCQHEVKSVKPPKDQALGYTTHKNKGVDTCFGFDSTKVLSMLAHGMGDVGSPISKF